MSTWVSVKKTQEICVHHLARRTSLVGRQPEALRRRVGGGGGGGEDIEDRRSTECRTTDGNWLKSEKRMNTIFKGEGDEKKWDGQHKRVQGNNTEAIRGNGGIIFSCHIISTDSRTVHNLHRFNNTPHALILGQLPNWCHLVGLLYSVSSELWLMGRLMVLLPLERCRQLGGGPVHTSSLSSIFLYTLIPLTDQIKAQTTNTRRLVTSVLEHTVHPSPSRAPLVTTQSQSPRRQHLQQWTSAH